MIIVYNPQLEEPPMDKECSITFSNIKEGGATTAVVLSSGVNRHISQEQWDQIKEIKLVKRHLNTGAIVVRDKEEETISDSAENVGTTVDAIKELDSLEEYKVPEAVELINATHEVEVLRRWFAKTERIAIRNTIAARLKALAEANG